MTDITDALIKYIGKVQTPKSSLCDCGCGLSTEEAYKVSKPFRIGVKIEVKHKVKHPQAIVRQVKGAVLPFVQVSTTDVIRLSRYKKIPVLSVTLPSRSKLIE